MFRHQIELLEMQIEEQRKREQALRTLNDTLQEEFRTLAAEKDQLEELNNQLADKLKNNKERFTEEIREY